MFPSTLQDYSNLFHVIDNIFTTWRSWWFWLYSMLTCIFLLYPAFVIGFLSDHARYKCIFLYHAWSKRKPITNAGYRRKMHLLLAFFQSMHDKDTRSIRKKANNKCWVQMHLSVPGICRFAYHLSIFDTRKQLKEFITRNSLHPFN